MQLLVLWRAAWVARQRLRKTFRDSIRPNKELTLNLPSNVGRPASHRLPIGQKNTVPRNHAAGRLPASNTNQPTNRRRRRILVIGAVIGVFGLFFGVRYWVYASTHEDTDDAYITGYTHQISSRIAGTVEEVLVDDNWHVTAGQPLLKLDPRD